MFHKLTSLLERWKGILSSSYQADLTTPQGRRDAFWHSQLMDHSFLRVFWTNLHELRPGVWRSNQPSPKRLAQYHDMGIRSVIVLRGQNRKSAFALEEEAAAKLGMTLYAVPLAARNLVDKRHLLHLLDLFDTVERPFLMHCKSGADRAGLASALYLMHTEGLSVEEASKELSLRYLHVKNDNTGVLDHMLEACARDMAETPMTIREWIDTRYDPAALRASFAATRGKPRG